MVDFTKARIEAFLAIKEIEIISLMEESHRRRFNFPNNAEVWEIKTEVYGMNNVGREVTLIIDVKDDFPLSCPKIYLSERDYSEIKYIPHVDQARFICTHDTETTRPDPLRPGDVVIECLRKAKQVISNGIQGINREDFEEEFLAYWSDTPLKEEFIRVLNIVQPTLGLSNLKLLELATPLRKYKFVVIDDSEVSKNFTNYLEGLNIKSTEHEIFHVENVDLPKEPPHDHTNRQIISLFGKMKLAEEFKTYVNRKINNLFVLSVITINNKLTFLGWFHKGIVLQRNGYRNSIDPYQALSTFHLGDKIIRVRPDMYTHERLEKRTSGNTAQKNRKFLIAGVGSIGSNMIHFLNSMNHPEFRLIDEDILKIENIGRHLLGFAYVNQPKTIALKNYLTGQNPITNILTRERSIVDVVNNELNFVNDADYIFCATGKTNIDQWLTEQLDSGKIVKPLFIIWIEPHLAGGHCLYLHPGSLKYRDFYEEETYKYNIISKEYYSKPANQLSLKEAGCQTTYIPYSAMGVIGFLSALFPYLAEIIQNNCQTSTAFSFIGNLTHISGLGIDLSEFAKGKAIGQIIKH